MQCGVCGTQFAASDVGGPDLCTFCHALNRLSAQLRLLPNDSPMRHFVIRLLGGLITMMRICAEAHARMNDDVVGGRTLCVRLRHAIPPCDSLRPFR